MKRQYTIRIKIVPTKHLSKETFKSVNEARKVVGQGFSVVRLMDKINKWNPCPHCNFHVKREYKFCPKCGNKQS